MTLKFNIINFQKLQPTNSTNRLLFQRKIMPKKYKAVKFGQMQSKYLNRNINLIIQERLIKHKNGVIKKKLIAKKLGLNL